MPSRRWMALAALVLLLAAAWFFANRRSGRGPAVDTGEVTRQDVFRSYVAASGEIVATRYADIGSSVMGRVVALNVAEGDRVRAGQVLARIDPVQARSDSQAASALVQALRAEQEAARQQVGAANADLAQARARQREAEQALERARRLKGAGLIPQADLDAAQAQADAATAQASAAAASLDRARQLLAAAESRIAQARAGVVRASDVLSKTEIAAPIDGVVSRLQVRLGEMVVIGIQNQPGTTLMTVSDLSGINAEIKVAEADVLRVAVGQPAEVVLEALAGRRFGGRVVEVGASALPQAGAGASAREFRVVVRLDAPDPGLRPGLTCDAEILAAERRNVLTVPLQAVVLRPGPDGKEHAGVFALRDGRARFVRVTTGIIGGLDIEIAGVDAKTPVIVGPFQVLRELQDGAVVTRKAQA
jgi:HlyD family secretion protein